MTTSISWLDWKELRKESVGNGNMSVQSDGKCDRIEQGHLGDLCQVYDRWVQIRDRLRLHVYNHEPLETLILQTEHCYIDESHQYTDSSHPVLSFFVTGNINTTLHPIVDDVAECSGKNYLCCHLGIRETEELRAGQKILRVRIAFDPQDLLTTFGTEFVEGLSPELLSLVTGTKLQPYYYLGTTTLQMQQAVQQILNCPYQGLLKQIYLESKALELMTLRLAQFLDDGQQTSRKIRLQQDDIDRIHWAKDILTDNVTDPPSLTALARLVGMNDCKLKQGFRQVFDTTAFGYLHQHRLEQARQLLATGKFSVTDVCHQVGFTDRSHFAAAFRKQFGLNPSVYRQECQGK